MSTVATRQETTNYSDLDYELTTHRQIGQIVCWFYGV